MSSPSRPKRAVSSRNPSRNVSSKATGSRPRQVKTTQPRANGSVSANRLAPPVFSTSKRPFDVPQGPSHPTSPVTDERDVCPRRSPLKLSDLECVKYLGEGGWAEVYLVKPKAAAFAINSRTMEQSERQNALFAMKVIPKRIFRDCERNDERQNRAEAAAKKHTERRCLATLPWNPFVTGVLDAFLDKRNTYLMLELAPCGSIRQQSFPLPVAVAQFYFANLVFGLEFLHSHGIIHRDIKTENLLLGADGYVMITDFGLSQFVNEGEGIDWDCLGTTQYMSPEVLMDDMASTEARYASDWWCAAVALFEMTFGNLPFDGTRHHEIAGNIKAQDINFPGRLPPFARDFFQKVFHPQLQDRLGARTVPKHEGGAQMNVELRRHPWLLKLRWDRIEKRIEVAPDVSQLASDVSRSLDYDWSSKPLPPQKKLPGLHVKRPFAQVEHEDQDQQTAENDRRKKRRVSQQPAGRND